MMGIPTEDGRTIRIAQDCLRERLCEHVLPPYIHGYENERGQLIDLLRRTITIGESNSILIVGPRGAGKSMLLKSVINELEGESGIHENVMKVELNGLLQTNDRIALKEITRQLQLENTVGDKVFGSFAENLQFLLEALKSGDKKSKSVLIVLDEFDLFAHHKNQTLLYNLFDVCQSAQAPLCVVGLTTRLDVMELLEKRVKSRFSHRQLFLLPTHDFKSYMKLFQSYLSLPDEFGDRKFGKSWNKKTEELMSEAAVIDTLKRQFNINKDVRALLSLLLLPVCRLTVEHPFLEPSDLVDSSKLLNTDSKSSMLHGLSVLELCLVIAMKFLTETYDGEPFNFEMVFSEYQKFGQRRSSMQVFEKAVVFKAFEHLCALELVCTAEGSSSKIQKEYRPMTLMIDSTQVIDALHRYPNCPTEVKQWGLTSNLG